jgi:cystathionine gamma-synthase
MSAITASLLTFLRQGSHVITTDDAYKKTLLFCDEWLPRFGVGRTVVKMGNNAALAAAIRKNTAVIIVESPTNPYLNILDFNFLKKLKKNHPGVIFIVDGTFGTPYNQRPLDYGADLVVHSVTKYLGGHNDLMGGAVLGGANLIGKIAVTQQMMGGIIDPLSSYLLIRGLKSFSIRMEKQNRAGLEIAKFLEGQPGIARVYYPGLESHTHHRIAKRQMKGFGGVVTFEIDGNYEGVKRFLNALRLCLLAPSFGGAESLVSHPASMSYYDYSREERLQLGIPDGLIRLSIGIEEVEDIKADLAAALRQTARSAKARKKI